MIIIVLEFELLVNNMKIHGADINTITNMSTVTIISKSFVT